MSPNAAASAPTRAPRWGWLLFSFARREVLARYAGSVTGIAWTLLHPLAQLAIFAVVFTQVFRAGVPPEYPGVNYVSFVAVALWPWIMFSEGVQRAMGSVAANAGLVRKVAFPHRLLVYSSVLSCCVVHGLGFLAVLAVLALLGQPLHLLRLPLALMLLVPYMLLAAGIGAALAALHILLRDVEQVVGVLLTMVFYASPILYPASIVPASLRRFVEANPLGWYSERLREVLFLGSGLVPGDALAALGCVAVFGAGLWIFQRLSPHFEDFL